MANCPDCRGTGLNPRRPLHACPTCGGSGDMAAYTRHLTREVQRANQNPIRRLIGRIFHV